ncbi:MAG: FIST C-terminal domain-containing protein [Rhodospirillales bacterium]|nr:FIST C-terminal domain-containing protein [Rhodospirillales bacterium]
MSPFKIAHTIAEDWAHAAKGCSDRLGDCGGQPALGFVYVTDALAEDLSSILTYLRQKTGLEQWIGTVGLGIFADGADYFDEPAMAAMVAPLPEDSFRLFPSLTEGAGQIPQDLRDWIGRTSPSIGIVHGDPSREDLVGLIEDVAQATSGFLVGGLTSSRAANHQVAGRVTGGGISGALLSPEIPVITGLSQGCSPIGESHEISDCLDNVLIGLDGRKALDVFRKEIGPGYSASLSEVGGLIHAALPIHGSDTGDYLVRSLVGIDPERGWLAIADQVEPGDRILFVKRDAETAVEDLKRMAERLKARIDGPPRGGVYVSCIARGPDMFGDAGGEMTIIRETLGEFPLIGFYANGEISLNRLYAYTGVLTLFL